MRVMKEGGERGERGREERQRVHVLRSTNIFIRGHRALRSRASLWGLARDKRRVDVFTARAVSVDRAER